MSPLRRPIRVLLVEPDEGTAEHLLRLLDAERDEFRVEHVEELSHALERLSMGGPDLVLLNLELPDSQGLVTFERTAAFAPDTPVVVLAGQGSEELAVASVQGGAQDFLVIPELSGPVLTRAARYAVERHRLLSALRSLSLIDDLTGLYNRRGFGDLGDHYLRLARRTGKPLTLIFLDVDRFKNINDSLGHHMGDRALLRVAEILRSNFRGSDLLGRIGGDEFAVLAPDSSDEPPEVLVRRIRDAMRAFNTSSREPYRLAVSLGTARYQGDAPVRLDDLLTQADAAMYDDRRGKQVVHS